MPTPKPELPGLHTSSSCAVHARFEATCQLCVDDAASIQAGVEWLRGLSDAELDMVILGLHAAERLAACQALGPRLTPEAIEALPSELIESCRGDEEPEWHHHEITASSGARTPREGPGAPPASGISFLSRADR